MEKSGFPLTLRQMSDSVTDDTDTRRRLIIVTPCVTLSFHVKAADGYQHTQPKTAGNPARGARWQWPVRDRSTLRQKIVCRSLPLRRQTAKGDFPGHLDAQGCAESGGRCDL